MAAHPLAECVPGAADPLIQRGAQGLQFALLGRQKMINLLIGLAFIQTAAYVTADLLVGHVGIDIAHPCNQ